MSPSQSTGLQTLLYVSDAVPGFPPGTVATLTEAARRRNRDEDLTGLLVFDGLRFAQVIEGSAQRVAALHERLLRDPRHTNIRTLYSAATPVRSFAAWRLGYLMIEPGTGSLEHLARESGAAALQAFLELRPGLHMDLGAAVPEPAHGSVPRGERR